jgi:acetylornithine/N-succinyldiaminopimelate aminotransferase
VSGQGPEEGFAVSAGDGVLVVKIGGAAVVPAGSGGLQVAGVLEDVAALRRAGRPVVVVHGGGPEITRWSERLGLQPRFVDGLRYSDPETVAVAEMALARVGKDIAAALTAAGAPALSLGGRDAALLTARPLVRRDADGRVLDLGLVGEIREVRTEVLGALLEAGLVPVLAPVAQGEDGQAYNVNADDAAADVAAALGASCLCLATDVPGVLVPGRTAPLPRCDGAEARRLIAEGVIRGGMRPKVDACLRAVERGVPVAWIVDGRRPGAVADAVAGREGAGTAFVAAETIAAVPAGGAADPEAAVLERYERYILQTYSRAPLVLVRGRGTTVWDARGRAYLDFLCGISVTNLGHCHPRVVAAVARQARELAHTSNLYHTLPQGYLAEELVGLAFPGRVFFCNSGAEANEGALKLCRKAHWRRAQEGGGRPRLTIVSFHHSFHGRTYGALAVTRGYQEGFGPMLEGFVELPWDDVAAAEAAIGPDTAGVIVEPVQGEGGVRPASPAFLRRLRELCDRYGACLIFDEVQCGLGRVGQNFAFQHYGVRPDVLTLGKALGAGLPMGAFLAAEPWAGALRRGDHATTFGGNPVVAAAALEGLRILREEGLAERSRVLGERLRQLLREGLEGCPLVREVRGLGLMVGVELDAGPAVGPAVVDACRERGVLINCTAGTVLRIMPPLTVDEAELERGAAVIVACVREAARAAEARPAAG